MDEQYYTTEELAYLLNVSTQSILRLIKQKRIRAIKFSKMYRIPSSSIEEFKLNELNKKEYGS